MTRTPSQPVPCPSILDIAPYKGGESGKGIVDSVIKLSSNESAYGPSPLAQTAYKEGAASIHRYPDGNATQLRTAIATRYDVDPDTLIFGAGSDEIIALLCLAYAGANSEVLYSQYGFLMYDISARAVGATPIAAPEVNMTTSIDNLLAHVTDRTAIVFVANPNNPTGTYIDADELARLHAALPAHVLLVIDGAYGEFMTDEDYDAGFALAMNTPNVVVIRTFSKIYGLGGARLGWAACPPHVADILNRVRGPFNVSTPALLAGHAAFTDTEFSDMVREKIIADRERVRAQLTQWGYASTDSKGNFLLVDFANSGQTAVACDGFLRTRGIYVRTVEGYGLPNHLRISIGTEHEMNALLEALQAFKEGHAFKEGR